jgi:hypothetical protein
MLRDDIIQGLRELATRTRSARTTKDHLAIMSEGQRLLTGMREVWASDTKRAATLSAFTDAYAPPATRLFEGLLRDSSFISFLVDVIASEDMAELTEVALDWLLGHVVADMTRLGLALDERFFLKRQRFWELVADRMASARRVDLAVAACLALRQEMPNRWVELTARVVELKKGKKASDAYEFAVGAVNTLVNQGRELELSQLERALRRVKVAVRPVSASVRQAADAGDAQRLASAEARLARLEAGANADGKENDALGAVAAAKLVGYTYPGFRKVLARDPDLQKCYHRAPGTRSRMIFSRNKLEQWKATRS